MAAVVTINCDAGNEYGTCATSSRPAYTVEDAIAIAESQGWLYRYGRDGAKDTAYCPGHAGTSRKR